MDSYIVIWKSFSFSQSTNLKLKILFKYHDSICTLDFIQFNMKKISCVMFNYLKNSWIYSP